MEWSEGEKWDNCNNIINKYIKNKKNYALAGVAQWIECQPVNQRVTDSQSEHMPGLRARFPEGGAVEATTH